MRLTPAYFRADLCDEDIEDLQNDLASARLIRLPSGCVWDFLLRFADSANPDLTAGNTLDLPPEQAAWFGLPHRRHRFDVASMSISFGTPIGTEYRLVEQARSGDET
ncbi:hypothetical protein [Microvirga massiliensis]|uniref:hypothetical protein n=1 Tax=Microvirga massiliensis TaxID=1033741 RepID=UPI00062BA380|nr:hypothetical protein [Microvirga massiliensis]